MYHKLLIQNMKKLFIPALALIICQHTIAQTSETPAAIKTDAVRPEAVVISADGLMLEKLNPSTPVKSQGMTGTCWSFSTTSLLESDLIRSNAGTHDLSEMYTARNIYIEKGKNYILRQGFTQFGEGGLGHDVIRSIDLYGAMPESAYSGKIGDQKTHDHSKMSSELKKYLDSALKKRPVDKNWLEGYTAILDKYMGTAPGNFTYNNKEYTPKSFASDAMKFKAEDYINLTSYSNQPYYKPYIINVPDNFSNGSYYNLPVSELLESVKNALKNGYTVMWDADVSNKGFRQNLGYALFIDPSSKVENKDFNVSTPEKQWSESYRQELIDALETQDDHLMHITGIEKTKDGRTFFLVKNSWGDVGPFKGYIHVSEAYFAMNTISLVLPRAAVSKSVLAKLKN